MYSMLVECLWAVFALFRQLGGSFLEGAICPFLRFVGLRFTRGLYEAFVLLRIVGLRFLSHGPTI
jgi:hypothetical protein